MTAVGRSVKPPDHLPGGHKPVTMRQGPVRSSQRCRQASNIARGNPVVPGVGGFSERSVTVAMAIAIGLSSWQSLAVAAADPALLSPGTMPAAVPDPFTAMFTLDAYGGIHPDGSTPVMATSAY